MAKQKKEKPEKKAEKKAAATPKRKGGGKGLSWKLLIIAMIAIGLALDISFSFVPENYVPAVLKPVHNKVLALRNTALAKTGLPISRYEDTATIPTEGCPPIKVHFAPSPKIAPALDGFIASAGRSLSVCAYDIDLPDVAGSLIAAKQHGVDVKVVTDTDNTKTEAIRRLEGAGIPVHSDHKPSLMHNKFIVADGYKVWTGSFNFTRNCSLKNDNNALEIDSPGLAAAYQAKFDEYWKGLFGQDAGRTGVKPDAASGGVPLTALFAPSDGVQSRILDELSSARMSVDVMAFSLTSKEISAKLASLASTGVKVRCLFDGSQAENRYSKDERLRDSGVKVRISANHSGKMHHKVMIIDNDTVLTGSYNFSNNAEQRNDENLLIIRSPNAASVYSAEFERCWNGTKGY